MRRNTRRSLAQVTRGAWLPVHIVHIDALSAHSGYQRSNRAPQAQPANGLPTATVESWVEVGEQVVYLVPLPRSSPVQLPTSSSISTHSLCIPLLLTPPAAAVSDAKFPGRAAVERDAAVHALECE